MGGMGNHGHPPLTDPTEKPRIPGAHAISMLQEQGTANNILDIQQQLLQSIPCIYPWDSMRPWWVRLLFPNFWRARVGPQTFCFEVFSDRYLVLLFFSVRDEQGISDSFQGGTTTTKCAGGSPGSCSHHCADAGTTACGYCNEKFTLALASAGHATAQSHAIFELSSHVRVVPCKHGRKAILE